MAVDWQGHAEYIRESGVTAMVTKSFIAYSARSAMELFFAYVQEKGPIVSITIREMGKE